MEETQVEMWNDMEIMEKKYFLLQKKVFFITKQLILHVIYLSLHYALQ
jgi:hypothetical protein